MYYHNGFGCLVVGFIIFFIAFLFFTRLLFTTPIGLILLAYLLYRWYIGDKKASKNQNMESYNTSEFNSEDAGNNDFFENEEVIDVDFDETDEDD